MPHLSTAERIGRKIGIAEGKAELLLHVIEQRFGGVSDEVRLNIESLPASKLNAFGVALMDFTSASDIEAWFTTRRAKR